MSPFNLELAIRAWLRTIRKSASFDDGKVEEMEVHLRDHMEDLMHDGHSEQSAFEIAMAEFGDVRVASEEERRNLLPSTQWYPFMFFRHHFKTGIRTFSKQPFMSTLNVLGLAIGMAGALLIAVFIKDELSFDQMFADADRIYRINIENQTNGEYSQYASAPGPMSGVIEEDCPHVELVTRFRHVGSALVRHPDSTLNVKERYVTAVDSSFFTMFGWPLKEGNPETALSDPMTLVLTTSAARRLFGEESALGKSVFVDNKSNYVVTGVMDPLPANSFLRDQSIFLSLSSFDDAETIAWNTWYFPTFVKLLPNSREADLQAFLNTVKENYLIPWASTFIPGLTVEKSRQMDEETGNFMRFNTMSLTDIHLKSHNREGEFSQNGDIQNVYILGVIGLFLILMAVVNFMNLATSNSLTRIKEVGIRKTLGSSRGSLIRKFLMESILLSIIASFFAIVVAYFALPLFNALAKKQMILPLSSAYFWLILGGIALFIGLLSGSYPALFLSRFAPVRMMKNKGTNGGKTFRNGLVIFQFSVSVFLILGTLVVFQQIEFIRSKDLGFQKEQILVLDDVDAAGQQLLSFRDEVRQLSRVENVSLSSYLPTPSERGGTTFFSEGSFVNGDFNTEQALIIENWDVDHEYIKTLGLDVIAGRDFNVQIPSDAQSLIINETTASMMNLTPDQAIGMRLTRDFRREDKENMEYLTVIGVVKNFHFESMRNRIDAVTFSLKEEANKMMVKLQPGNFGAIEEVQDAWHRIAPGQPFHYYFMDDSFNDTYQADLRLGKIFITFTQLSVFIACLGLFGLSAFSAQRRSKEIGIKKVLGASINRITLQLSLDFLKLVLVALMIGLPIGWITMNKWLEEFVFRININAWTLGASACLVILISLFTISFQSIRAAIANPVKSLQNE